MKCWERKAKQQLNNRHVGQWRCFEKKKGNVCQRSGQPPQARRQIDIQKRSRCGKENIFNRESDRVCFADDCSRKFYHKKKNSPRLSNLTTMDARHLKAKYIYLLTPQLCVAFKKFKWALEWYRLPSKMPTVARDSFSDILTVPPADGQPADARSYRAWFLKWDQEKKNKEIKQERNATAKQELHCMTITAG